MTSDTNKGTLRLPGGRSAATTAQAPILRAALKAPPDIRGIYWCGFPDAALAPEFSKRRPVVVVSYKNSMSGPILVVPSTSQPQPNNAWAIKLENNPCPGETCEFWVVCNHLYTVSCLRLTTWRHTVARLTEAEFRPIHELILKWLPALPTPPTLPTQSHETPVT
jgi:mRNA interferase MazF